MRQARYQPADSSIYTRGRGAAFPNMAKLYYGSCRLLMSVIGVGREYR
ncbi:rCG30696 [Rattus norvegicus]|uniref:RCG30696 n=1 Tax=Rattus norvegicus TaxID=10116 RepID=A6ITD0_RAT|nr:rCG30696 [Rattus norvegicus]